MITARRSVDSQQKVLKLMKLSEEKHQTMKWYDEIVIPDSELQGDITCDFTAEELNLNTTSVEDSPEKQSQCEVSVSKPNCDRAFETAQGKSRKSKKLFKDRTPKRPLVATTVLNC